MNLHVRKNIAKYPRISSVLLRLTAAFYTSVCTGYLLSSYPLVSSQMLVACILDFPFYWLLCSTIDRYIEEVKRDANRA